MRTGQRSRESNSPGKSSERPQARVLCVGHQRWGPAVRDASHFLLFKLRAQGRQAVQRAPWGREDCGPQPSPAALHLLTASRSASSPAAAHPTRCPRRTEGAPCAGPRSQASNTRFLIQNMTNGQSSASAGSALAGELAWTQQLLCPKNLKQKQTVAIGAEAAALTGDVRPLRRVPEARPTRRSDRSVLGLPAGLGGLTVPHASSLGDIGPRRPSPVSPSAPTASQTFQVHARICVCQTADSTRVPRGRSDARTCDFWRPARSGETREPPKANTDRVALPAEGRGGGADPRASLTGLSHDVPLSFHEAPQLPAQCPVRGDGLLHGALALPSCLPTISMCSRVTACLGRRCPMSAPANPDGPSARPVEPLPTRRDCRKTPVGRLRSFQTREPQSPPGRTSLGDGP
ncbi:uncharacterized protein LOC121473957 [Vulpes lagopus]|uniref:uncharacterized protein LOC121473957 n=1 Tax=Vulpes lagopus TaxID=494514 RepID=UPI001BC945DB|nr:uncharacterized protein LOC121473957 [Vulpes lagopus]